MHFSPLFPVIAIVSTDHVYFHHKIVLILVVIQNFQLEVVNNSHGQAVPQAEICRGHRTRSGGGGGRRRTLGTTWSPSPTLKTLCSHKQQT